MKKNINIILTFMITLTIMFGFHTNVYASEWYDLIASNSIGTSAASGDSFIIEVGVSGVSLGTTISKRDITIYYDGTILEACDYEANEDDDECVGYRNGWTWLSSAKYHNTKDAYVRTEMSAKTENDNIKNCEYCDGGTVETLYKRKFKVKDNVPNQTTTITIVDDNNQKRTINLNIHTKSTNAYLKELNLNFGGVASPISIDKENTYYEVFAPYDTDKAIVSAIPEDSKAIVTGTGERQLVVGENRIDLEVTAENGAKRTYTVNIFRSTGNSDTTLSKVKVTDSKKKKVDLKYDTTTKTYKGYVTSDITFVSFDIACSGFECKVNKLAPEELKEGTNEFKVTVSSQDGNSSEYKIVIEKAKSEKEDNTIEKDNNIILYIIIGVATFITILLTAIVVHLKNKKTGE